MNVYRDDKFVETAERVAFERQKQGKRVENTRIAYD